METQWNPQNRRPGFKKNSFFATLQTVNMHLQITAQLLVLCCHVANASEQSDSTNDQITSVIVHLVSQCHCPKYGNITFIEQR